MTKTGRPDNRDRDERKIVIFSQANQMTSSTLPTTFPAAWVVSVGLAMAVLAALPNRVMAEDSDGVVKLVVEFGDGVEWHYTGLNWQADDTVWTVMERAAKHPRGVLLKHQGRGDTLLVLAIADVANEGGGGRNWIYRVNDELGDRSAAIREVQAGDTILWRFERYQ